MPGSDLHGGFLNRRVWSLNRRRFFDFWKVCVDSVLVLFVSRENSESGRVLHFSPSHIRFVSRLVSGALLFQLRFEPKDRLKFGSLKASSHRSFVYW